MSTAKIIPFPNVAEPVLPAATCYAALDSLLQSFGAAWDMAVEAGKNPVEAEVCGRFSKALAAALSDATAVQCRHS